ncbi:hypothetical protein BD410DRAFT_809861 [Rickenella mellea]|uniref:Uncharacterized protein n=1 Tax=Rickenella mellea TaxID=50990 RepID=A0A4Y7PG35_9AGAM|nr:hypothetical protein BD410DRAFT_809861 [Rickenella mellea]
MAPHRWASPDQLKWLRAKLPLFLSSVQGGSRERFWASSFEEWFAKYPESHKPIQKIYTEPEETPENCTPEETPEEMPEETPDGDKTEMEIKRQTNLQLRRGMLENWFKNNRGIGNKKTRAAPQVKVDRVKKRLKQDVELFQKRYYDELVKPEVEKVLEANKKAGQKVATIVVVREKTKLAWASASEEVRLEVAEMQKAQQKEKEDEEELTISGSAVIRTESQIQKSIENIAPNLQPYLDQMAADTGYQFFVVGAGPEPKAGNTIQVVSLHTGKTELGTNFGNAYPRFDEDVCEPFVDFVKKATPNSTKRTAPDAVADGLSLDDPGLVTISRSTSPLLDTPSAAPEPSTLNAPPRKTTKPKPANPTRPLVSEYEQMVLDNIALNRKKLDEIMGGSGMLDGPLFPPRPTKVQRQQRTKRAKGVAPVRRSRRSAGNAPDDIEDVDSQKSADGDTELRADEADGEIRDREDDGNQTDNDEAPPKIVDPFQTLDDAEYSADPDANEDAPMKSVDPFQALDDAEYSADPEANEDADPGANEDAPTKSVETIPDASGDANPGANEDAPMKSVETIPDASGDANPGANEDAPMKCVEAIPDASGDANPGVNEDAPMKRVEAIPDASGDANPGADEDVVMKGVDASRGASGYANFGANGDALMKSIEAIWNDSSDVNRGANDGHASVASADVQVAPPFPSVPSVSVPSASPTVSTVDSLLPLISPPTSVTLNLSNPPPPSTTVQATSDTQIDTAADLDIDTSTANAPPPKSVPRQRAFNTAPRVMNTRASATVVPAMVMTTRLSDEIWVGAWGLGA